MDGFMTLLGSYCFPIVACIVMAWYVRHVTDQNREDTKELNKQHTEEMTAFRDEIKTALNNNTLALNKLCDKLDNDYLRKEGSDNEVK